MNKKDPRNYDFEAMKKQKMEELYPSRKEDDNPSYEYEEKEVNSDYDYSDEGAQDYICGIAVSVSMAYLQIANDLAMPKDREPTDAEVYDFMIKGFYIFATGDVRDVIKAKHYQKMNSEKAKEKAVDLLVDFEEKATNFFVNSGVEEYGNDFYDQIQEKMNKFNDLSERVPENDDGKKK